MIELLTFSTTGTIIEENLTRMTLVTAEQSDIPELLGKSYYYYKSSISEDSPSIRYCPDTNRIFICIPSLLFFVFRNTCLFDDFEDFNLPESIEGYVRSELNILDLDSYSNWILIAPRSINWDVEYSDCEKGLACIVLLKNKIVPGYQLVINDGEELVWYGSDRVVTIQGRQIIDEDGDENFLLSFSITVSVEDLWQVYDNHYFYNVLNKLISDTFMRRFHLITNNNRSVYHKSDIFQDLFDNCSDISVMEILEYARFRANNFGVDLNHLRKRIYFDKFIRSGLFSIIGENVFDLLVYGENDPSYSCW